MAVTVRPTVSAKLGQMQKGELVAIMDGLSIQVDNPLVILTQETSKNFLRGEVRRAERLRGEPDLEPSETGRLRLRTMYSFSKISKCEINCFALFNGKVNIMKAHPESESAEKKGLFSLELSCSECPEPESPDPLHFDWSRGRSRTRGAV